MHMHNNIAIIIIAVFISCIMFICTRIAVVVKVSKTAYMQECMNYTIANATIRLTQSTGSIALAMR